MKNITFTVAERKLVNMSALIFALRLFGLFMILPVFSLSALSIPGANAHNISITLGLYGLAAVVFQPLFGLLSDRYDRKRIIAIGLAIFIIGSLLATLATNIHMIMFGRFLQGGGAIGSVLLALIADHTREEVRTKAMMVIGITLTLSFILSIIFAPLLVSLIHLNGLFAITTCLGVIGLIMTLMLPSSPVRATPLRFEETLVLMLKNQDILILNLSIFMLHAILIGTFTALPFILVNDLSLKSNVIWLTYLVALIIALGGMLLLIHLAERFYAVKRVTIFVLLMIMLGLLFLWSFETNYLYVLIGLTLFFMGFLTLEALLPSWLSRILPPHAKGGGMGTYSMMQFLGAFAGGVVGSLNTLNSDNTLLWALTGAVLWFMLATKLKPLQKKPIIPDTVESP